jgi:hypothetical protein
MRLTVTLVALAAALVMASPASGQELKFEADLSGAAERPTPVVTEGVGDAKFESDGMSVDLELKWDDLSSPAFAAHIHCAPAGSNGPVGVTLFTGTRGVEGEVVSSFSAPDPGNGCGWTDLSDVLDAMATGGAYVNVHTTQHPGGEVRGQVAMA